MYTLAGGSIILIDSALDSVKVTAKGGIEALSNFPVHNGYNNNFWRLRIVCGIPG
jgi:hypothetical protein